MINHVKEITNRLEKFDDKYICTYFSPLIDNVYKIKVALLEGEDCIDTELIDICDRLFADYIDNSYVVIESHYLAATNEWELVIRFQEEVYDNKD